MQGTKLWGENCTDIMRSEIRCRGQAKDHGVQIGCTAISLSAQVQEAALVFQVRQKRFKRMQNLLCLGLAAARGRIMIRGRFDIVPEAHHVAFDHFIVRCDLCHAQAIHAHLNLELSMLLVLQDRFIHFWHAEDIGVTHMARGLGGGSRPPF